MKKAGLNVRVITLTGKKSEQVLQDMIKKIYPNGENKQIWISNQREIIIQLQLKKLQKQYDDGMKSRSDPSSMRDEDTGRILSLIDFSTPKAFLSYYRRLMRKEHATRDKITTQFKKYNYRSNPFHPENI